MNASTKLGLVLLIIFTTCLFALILQLVYLLQRKRTPVVNGGVVSVNSAAADQCGSPNSKELLYFFCCKNKPTRVEPSSGAPSMTVTEAATVDESEEEDYDDELAKWQEAYGRHSMFLYTIKEGEREGADSVEDSSGRRSEGRVCSKECLSGRVEMENDAAVVVVVVEEEEDEEETPCAASDYFTPSTSLHREDDGISILSSESDDVGSSEGDR